jgi:hypothetical protein
MAAPRRKPEQQPTDDDERETWSPQQLEPMDQEFRRSARTGAFQRQRSTANDP